MNTITNNTSETSQKAIMINGIEENVKRFNSNKRKNLISVKHYVANGDQYKIIKGNKVIVDFLTLDQCYYAIVAIINYCQSK